MQMDVMHSSVGTGGNSSVPEVFCPQSSSRQNRKQGDKHSGSCETSYGILFSVRNLQILFYILKREAKKKTETLVSVRATCVINLIDLLSVCSPKGRAR